MMMLCMLLYYFLLHSQLGSKMLYHQLLISYENFHHVFSQENRCLIAAARIACAWRRVEAQREARTRMWEAMMQAQCVAHAERELTQAQSLAPQQQCASVEWRVLMLSYIGVKI